MLALLACSGTGDESSDRYEVTARFPHDPSAYTQGLLWADTVLYESTGVYTRSELRRVDLHTGKVLASVALPRDRFGEGLALLSGRLYQLTWESGIAYVYDAASLALRDSIRYAGEGWGLTTYGDTLIMSDGSDSLRFVDPETFQTVRAVHVRHNGAPLVQLNELEFVNGEILANVFRTSWVARIDPVTGTVRETINFAELYRKRPATVDVMNGIAISPDGTQLLLTGKLWPVMFQVRLRPRL